MNRARWWVGRHPENALYLLIVALVAVGFVIALTKGGGW